MYMYIYIHLCGNIACTFYVHWHRYSMRDWHLQVPKIDKSICPSDSFPVLDRRQLESLGIWRHGMMKLDSVVVLIRQCPGKKKNGHNRP